MPNGRVHAVGADQHVGFDRRAVLELRLDVVTAIDRLRAAMVEMQPLARQRLRQQLMHLAAMKHPERRAVALLGLVGEPRKRERAAVLPAPLVETVRPHRDGLQLSAEAELDQQPRCIRADHQAGTGLAELGRLLVDLDVEAGAHEIKRRDLAADTTADYRNR